MSDEPDVPDEPDEAKARRRSAERARRRARVFGEVLPESTSDDRPAQGDVAPAQGEGADPGEDWLRANVPPHHGS